MFHLSHGRGTKHSQPGRLSICTNVLLSGLSACLSHCPVVPLYLSLSLSDCLDGGTCATFYECRRHMNNCYSSQFECRCDAAHPAPPPPLSSLFPPPPCSVCLPARPGLSTSPSEISVVVDVASLSLIVCLPACVCLRVCVCECVCVLISLSL